MPHSLTALRKHAEAAAPIEIELRFKPMFGGIGVYANGRMCMTLSSVGLALKLGQAERAQLLCVKGSKPLQYEPNSPPSKSYVVVPDSMVRDRAELGRWIALSAAFAAGADKQHKRRAGSKMSAGR